MPGGRSALLVNPDQELKYLIGLAIKKSHGSCGMSDGLGGIDGVVDVVLKTTGGEVPHVAR
jgi:hypothetical protein